MKSVKRLAGIASQGLKWGCGKEARLKILKAHWQDNAKRQLYDAGGFLADRHRSVIAASKLRDALFTEYIKAHAAYQDSLKARQEIWVTAFYKTAPGRKWRKLRLAEGQHVFDYDGSWVTTPVKKGK